MSERYEVNLDPRYVSTVSVVGIMTGFDGNEKHFLKIILIKMHIQDHHLN